MLRPIQITPITDQTPIRQTLIPNTMSQEQFMANQLAGNNVQLQQPVSPVQGLVASGQEGLQGAERISKQIARSPRVQGLLGGGETAQGLLGDIQGQAALTGLFSTLQAIGRPVRRGEDRFLGAVQYGQQAMADAQQRGLQGLSTQLQLEQMAREQAMAGQPQFSILSAEQKQQMGIPQDTIAQVELATGKVSTVGGGGVNVSVGGGIEEGKLSTDFTFARDKDGNILRQNGVPIAVPVIGSPAYQELQQREEKQEGRQEQQARAGTTVIQDLGRALDIVRTNPMATGRSASAILSLPEIARAETDVQAASGFIESALSNVGLDTLQEMRENSPTGGALGQVPIQQQRRLEQVLGSLDLTQRQEVVEDNIKRVMNIYTDIVHGTPSERAKAIEEGKLSPEENERIETLYLTLSFDERGRPVDLPAPEGISESLWDRLSQREKIEFLEGTQ